MSKKVFTHRELCEIGARLLRRPESQNGHGCHFALIEPSSYGENADVIGYRHGNSFKHPISIENYIYKDDIGTVLLEAKTSRADFLKDKLKSHRKNPSQGVGRWRYFICPDGLIQPNELPDKWGLIYVNSRGHCKFIAGALAVESHKHSNGRYKNHNELALSFAKHSFEERNVQNEMNILVMALNRIQDVEDILYLKRELGRKEQIISDLISDVDSANRKTNDAIAVLNNFKKSKGLIN